MQASQNGHRVCVYEGLEVSHPPENETPTYPNTHTQSNTQPSQNATECVFMKV